MPHPDHPSIESALMKNLFAPGSAFAFAFIFLVFQYSFKLDFQCPCNAFSNDAFCFIYILIPSFGLLLVLTLTTKTCTIMCTRGSCSRACCSRGCFWRNVCKHIVRNLVLSSLWIATIFIDGDAWVCYKLTENNITNWYDQTPCKEKNKHTAEESTNIRFYQAQSQVIGLLILFIIPLLWMLCSMIYRCHKTPYKSLFEDVYEEETMRCAEMEMRERIKIKNTEKCRNILNNRGNCDDAWNTLSNELINVITEEDPATLNQPTDTLDQNLMLFGRHLNSLMSRYLEFLNNPPQPNENLLQPNQDLPPLPNQDPPPLPNQDPPPLPN